VGLPLWARLTGGLGVAAALAYMTTPVAIVAARRLAFYDMPIGYKGHKRPTPYLGGAAVMTAFVVALLLAFPDSTATLLLVGGVAVLFTLGTIDDRRTVSPLLRVVVEFILGALLSELGHGWRLGAGQALDATINGIWVVGVVNAFNLFDNMDGAASAMAVAASAGICILALFAHDPWAATASIALCGACLGFLPHNLARPARIFLGDGGSMPLGFAVAVLAASAARTAEPSLLALLTGLLLVGIPALDTCLVVVSRRRRGISILTGGQDHLTHRTRRRMRTALRVALVLGSTQAVLSALVIVATRADSAAVVYVVLGFVVCAAAAIVGLDGHLAAAGGEVTALTGLEPRATVGAEEPTAAVQHSDAHRPPSRLMGHGAMLALALLGLGAGLSALFSAYYSATAWVPLGLVLVIAAAAAAVARPPRLSLPGALALAGVAGLGLWSLLSTSWAQAVEQATVGANLWLAYAALLLLLLVLTRSRRHAALLLITIGLGIAVVGATVLVRMLGSDPGALFDAGRLNAPLGYVNGEGCLFAMGCWLSLGLAERREPLLAALGAAATVAMASLALLSQSRGTAIASLAAIVVALLVVPGIRRRTLALVVVAAGVGAAAGPVLKVYSAGQNGALPGSVAHSAAAAILLFSLLAGLAWGLITAAGGAVERRGSRPAALLRRCATALTIIFIAGPVVLGIARYSSIEHTARSQWHAFVNLSESAAGSSPSATETRLLSGAGNRYDYWRIAWHVFTSHPIAGVGAGNYTGYYFAQRRTQEAIQNPHSIELQTLSELGLVGAVLLALLVGGVTLGAVRLRRAARRRTIDRTLMVGATGVAVVWLVDTSGDWMHLLPGVTAIALAAAAVLCRSHDQPPSAPQTPGARLTVRGLGAAAVVAFVLVVAGASLLRSELVQRYVDSAQSELARAPASAISDAQRALRLDGANLDAYYTEAAGQARFDRPAAARSALLAATSQDPRNFVTWVLLGDLEVRLRNYAAARRYYGRAHALDPNDPSVAQLAADPAAALSSTGQG
jgi:UDP-GlcNAc:undecaprenyl-phosphate GlcNAc-1-phosphate transferase